MTEVHINDTTRFLKKTKLLREVSPEQLEELEQKSFYRKIRQGDILFRNGDASNYLYFLKSGLITESINYRDSVDVIIKLKIPGDYFGETAVMTGIPYLSTSLAVADSTVLAIPKEAFLNLARSNFCVCQMVITELTERLTKSAQKMVNNMYLNAEGRLASVIMSMIVTLGKSRPYELPITQEKLAASCGLSRQTAAQIIGNWKRDGWIATGRGKIIISDITPLLQIVANSEMHC